MNKSKIFLLLLCFNGALFAQDVKMKGVIHRTVPMSHQSQSITHANEQPATQSITLLNIQLSERAKKILHQLVKHPSKSAYLANTNRQASSKQLGMNHTPVFDQGMHGTCVTFAATAAIDALLNQGDYVSQLCLLQLGQHFEHEGYSPSGWEGSWGHVVLSHINNFGIVNKTQQKQHGCGGLYHYPKYDDAPETEMSLTDYHQISEDIGLGVNKFAWTTLLDVYETFFMEEAKREKALNLVKASINSGDRVMFGVILADFSYGVAGAVGKYQQDEDTWVLSADIQQDIEDETDELAGHEMVITGYDDEAIAIDPEGVQHKGLLTLRNSWGKKVGDHGNFYMSYDYFNLLVLEAHRIRKLPPLW